MMRHATEHRAILWDNDGVLVDTERWYFHATQETFARVGIELTQAMYFEYYLARSEGTWHLARDRGLGDADIAMLRDARNQRYQELLETEPIDIAGVREALEALRPHFAMGVVTSSRRDHFEAIHRRTGLMEFFDFALTEGDYARVKPGPDGYLAAIDRTGLPVSACLAIEDAPRGLAAAVAAGLRCWVIPTEFTRPADFSAADRILSRISDVVPLLLSR